MRRWARRRGATAVAPAVVLRGGLALLVALVGVLCLFTRAMEAADRTTAAERPAVTVAVAGPQMSAASHASAEPTAPCGKEKAVAESGTVHTHSQADAPALAAPAQTPDVARQFITDTVHSRTSGPEPPPPPVTTSVLRI
ncbi:MULTISPECIES: hypothetical protein [unclassified Streptomyces]|uniref:hypothetical protein n=1 Tax=unclassified Streptomyces TaxID=2593676 RepID=UPI00278C0DCB|nr:MULTISPECIES: hypothetical protein [unclassified Streptomyces]